jgi:hypothetical protein
MVVPRVSAAFWTGLASVRTSSCRRGDVNEVRVRSREVEAVEKADRRDQDDRFVPGLVPGEEVAGDLNQSCWDEGGSCIGIKMELIDVHALLTYHNEADAIGHPGARERHPVSSHHGEDLT